METALKRGPAPQLVWAGSDLMAFGAMEAAEAQGLQPGRELLFGAINTSDEAMQALIDGRLSALAGGHFLTGAFALVLLHDLHRGHDFADEGLTLERPMFMRFDRIAAQRFLARPSLSGLDFRRYSKVHKPQLRRYQVQSTGFAGRGCRALGETLHKSGRDDVVRIGMGCKAQFEANSRSYWREVQGRRPPDAALAGAGQIDAEFP